MQSNLNDTHCNFLDRFVSTVRIAIGYFAYVGYPCQWYRGYGFLQMDYCDYVWDISLKRSFFKDNRLRAIFEWYDIFDNKNNSRYRISDYYIHFYRYYKVNSYMMLSLEYNL